MITCPQCHRANEDSCRFCGGCGTPLPAATVRMPPVVPMVPPVAPRRSRLPLALVILGGLALVAIVGFIVAAAGVATWVARPATPVVVTPAPLPPAPAPLREPALTSASDHEYTWDVPNAAEGRATIYFDNGTGEPVTVRLADRAEFTVAARERAELRTTPGKLAFTVSGGALDAPDAHAIDLEGQHIYVYNPLAAWDYAISSHTYSVGGIEGGVRSTEVLGAVFFDAGEIDFPFKKLPKEVTLSGFSATSRSTIAHSAEAPRGDRRIRHVKAGAGEYRLITWRDGPVVVESAQDPARAAPLFVDNAYAEDVRLVIDEAPICTIAADNQQAVHLFAGTHRLAVLDKDGKALARYTCKTEADHRYVWSPQGEREFVVDYQRYGTSPLFAGDKVEKRSPVSMRGLSFFEIHTSFAFEPFPTSVQMSALAMDVWKSRLSVGEGHGSSADVQADLQGVEASARQQLRPALFKTFQARRPKAGDAVSDCDVYLVRGLLAGLQGNTKTAERDFEVVADFAPERADLYRLRGLMRNDGKEYRAAADDLDKAIELDSTLEASLKPTLEAARAAAEKAETAP